MHENATNFAVYALLRLFSIIDGIRAGVCPCVCPSVCLSIRVFTLLNMNISKTSGLIAIKFYLKLH